MASEQANPERAHAESRARTAVAALQRCGVGGRMLALHVVGADDREGRSAAETLAVFGPLLAWLDEQGTAELELGLVGPNLQPRLASTDAWFDHGRLRVRVWTSTQLYQDVSFGEGTSFSRPDLLLCFNAGVWGYSDWLPALRFALGHYSCPIVVTSYTEIEADSDWEALEEGLTDPAPIWFWEPALNPFRSPVPRATVVAAVADHPRFENMYWQCIAPAGSTLASSTGLPSPPPPVANTGLPATPPPTAGADAGAGAGAGVGIGTGASGLSSTPTPTTVTTATDPRSRALDGAWWRSSTEEDPITLEPICELEHAPFVLESQGAKARCLFDPDALSEYLVTTGRFENPLTREPLGRADVARLQQQSPHATGSDTLGVLALFDVQAQVRVGAGAGAGASTARRREGATALASLFQFSSGTADQRRRANAHAQGGRSRARASGSGSAGNGSGGFAMIDDDLLPSYYESTGAGDGAGTSFAFEESFPMLPLAPHSSAGGAAAAAPAVPTLAFSALADHLEAAAQQKARELEAVRQRVLVRRKLRAEQQHAEHAAAVVEARARAEREREKQAQKAEQAAQAEAAQRAADERRWRSAEQATAELREQQARQRQEQDRAAAAAAAREEAEKATADAARRQQEDEAAAQAAAEAEERRRQQKADKKRRQREKAKAKRQQEQHEAEQQRAVEAREQARQQAAQAGKKCTTCGKGLVGKLSAHFSFNDEYFCSTACVRAARTRAANVTSA